VAEKFTLEAQPRTILGKKVKQLRRQGLVPVSVFGPKIEPVNLQIPYRPLQITLMNAGGTHLIDLQVDGDTTTVLARQVQRDVIRGDILHVDFFAVDMRSTIKTDVPIHFVGESPAVVSRVGILITGPTVITIETLPSNLLGQIEIDLSQLVNVGDSLHVRDLNLGPDIVIINDPNEMIAQISQPSAVRAEEEEEAEAVAAAEEVSAEPEVIAKGKVEEAEEE
jgi:large subunit ribosomal protein L25